MKDENFLSRWSRLKREGGETKDVAPAQAGGQSSKPEPSPPPPLPPVESLTPDSDFTPFLREGVEEALKRKALKTLFQDPRFNVMDGLDVYIDDYSKADPLPPGWLEKMNQVTRLGEYKQPAQNEADAEQKPHEDEGLGTQSTEDDSPTGEQIAPLPDINDSGPDRQG